MKSTHIKNILFILTTIICGSTIPTSYGQIVVQDNVFSFTPKDKLIKSFPVGNASSDKTIAIRLEAFELDYSKETPELRPTNDLVIVPSRMQLSPKKSQLARLIVKKRPQLDETEKVYRLKLIPSLVEENTDKQTDVIKQKITVLSSSGIMVLVTPNEINSNYNIKRNNSVVRIKNTGNVNLIFRQEGQCAENINCTIDGIRLWPGKTWQLNIPEMLQEQDIHLEMRSLEQVETITVKGQD